MSRDRPVADPPAEGGEDRRRWRRRTLAAAGFVLLVLILGLIPAWTARSHLQEARASLQAGRDSLLSGESANARRSFEEARRAFEAADGASRSPLLAIPRLLPILGRTPDAVHSMASGGGLVARAGVSLADALAALPDGVESLAPRNGIIPLEPLRSVAPGIARASDLVDRAVDVAERSPASWLIGPVAEAHGQFAREVGSVARTLRAASALTAALPEFLGDDGPRRYFLGAANPAELRGTAGYVGAYSILNADGGTLTLSPFRPIQSLRNTPVTAPSEEFERLYPGAAGFWPNINQTPDFPTAATAMEGLYRAVTGTEVHGTLLVDPFALRSMMAVTGPVTVTSLPEPVTADTVVSLLTNRAYALLEDPEARKAILGHVARAILGRFLSGSGDVEGTVRAVTDATSAGHLLVHSADPVVDRAFRLAHAGDAIRSDPGDFLAVVVNNAAGNKVDFYVDRSIDYRVALGAEGNARGLAEVRFRNAAPASGMPPYVIGPFPGASEAGEMVGNVSLYAPRDAAVRVTLDGEAVGSREEQERGRAVLRNTVRVASRGESRIEHDRALPSGWSESGGEGLYRLSLQGQTTIRPTRARIEVVVPGGYRVVFAEGATRVLEDRVIWEGVLGPRHDLEVRFRKPWLSRTADAILDFLRRELVSF